MNMIKVNNHPTGLRHRRHGHPFADFDRLFNEFCYEDGKCAWTPRTDIIETDGEHLIIVELPGLDKNDISIKAEDRILSITGEMAKSEDMEGHRVRRQERFTGAFKRNFRLPAGIETDKIGAEFKNGLLTVSLPKSEAAVGREIEVK